VSERACVSVCECVKGENATSDEDERPTAATKGSLNFIHVYIVSSVT